MPTKFITLVFRANKAEQLEKYIENGVKEWLNTHTGYEEVDRTVSLTCFFHNTLDEYLAAAVTCKMVNVNA